MTKIICDKDGNREMTAKELAEYEKAIAGVETFPADFDERLALEQKKAADRVALLARLGITEEEAKLLLG